MWLEGAGGGCFGRGLGTMDFKNPSRTAALNDKSVHNMFPVCGLHETKLNFMVESTVANDATKTFYLGKKRMLNNPKPKKKSGVENLFL